MTSLNLRITRMDLAEQVIDGLCSTPFVCVCGYRITGYANKKHCAMCGWYEFADIRIETTGATTKVSLDGGLPVHIVSGDSVQFTTRNGEGQFLLHVK